ncbi:MAG TPA: efflux transporter periplasmic adaptor subunit, partial [Tistrella mobilis]|nr:efflux transporter periplasmic adaptor subunit [Tistrella mobilis]
MLLLVLAAAGYGIWRYAFPEAPPAPPPTVAVHRADLEDTVLANGTLEAIKMVSVGAQVSGQIKTLAVDVGDKVKAGDLIAEIDSLNQQNDLRNAEAALANVRAQYRAKQAALKQAELAFRRERELLAGRAGARADYENAEATLATTKAELAALEAQIAQAEITVDTAKVDLGYTRITAPMDGTIVAVVAKEGQTVNAVQSAPTIVMLAQLDTMTVTAEVSEADVTRVVPGQDVYFTILGEPGRRYTGKLRSVYPAPESVATTTSSTT